VADFSIESGWRASGRACESGWINLNGMSWDPFHETPWIDIMQTKTSKLKKIPFPAGADRQCCWFLKFGDYMTLKGKQFLHKPGEAMFLFPELQSVKSAGKKLGDYMSAVLPREEGGLKRFEKVAVLAGSLPKGICAGGIRPGACNTMAVFMPAEILVHSTGHELKGTCSVHEYIDTKMPLCIPGAVVLAGFPPFPWGHLGRGPSAPSLKHLKSIGVSMVLIVVCIDKLMNIDSSSAPVLQVGGPLRPMVEASFAAMVMYHEERLEAGEYRTSCLKLEATVKKYYTGINNPREAVCMWGRHIKQKFAADNARLFGMVTDTVPAQMAQSMRMMGNMVGEMQTMMVQMQREINSMRTQLALTNTGASSSSCGSSIGAASSSSDSGSGVAPVVLDAVIETEEMNEDEQGTKGENKFSGLGSLLPDVKGDTKERLSSSSAAEIYIEFTLKGRPLNGWALLDKRECSKLKIIYSWFDLATLPEELQFLKSKDPESGKVRAIANTLDGVVRQRIAYEFKQRTKSIPTSLRAGKVLGYTTIERLLSALKKIDHPIELVPENTDLLVFRKVRASALDPVHPVAISASPSVVLRLAPRQLMC
jgi:hypothetical protein